MTALLLFVLILTLAISFFSLQKQMDKVILPGNKDRTADHGKNVIRENILWSATTCAGYTCMAENIEVVYHQEEKENTLTYDRISSTG